MKTFLLAVGFAVLTASAHAQAIKWFRTDEAIIGRAYDRSGGNVEFSPGEVFPVSRVMTEADLDDDLKRELERADHQLVVPLRSGNCIIVPQGKGEWITAGDPKYSHAITVWNEYDKKREAKENQLISQEKAAANTEKIAKRRTIRAEKEAAALDAASKAAQLQQANELRKIRQELQRR